MIKDTIIPVISLKALIRHQNHLKININPVPAPICRRIEKVLNALLNSKANNAEKTMSNTVVILPTATNLFSEASGFKNRL